MHNLKTALIHFAITGAVLWLMGCSVPHAYRPVCKHTALFCAQTVQDLTGQPVRIAVYERDGRLVHVQGETFRDGRWRPLYANGGMVYEGDVDIEGATVNEYCDLDLFQKVYFNWVYDLKNKEKTK